MKPHSFRHILKIVPLALSLIVTMACGKKNQVKSATLGAPIPVMGIPNLPGTSGAQIQQIISAYPCAQGQRMPEIQLSTSGAAPNGNNTLISGPYNSGQISGPIAMVFVGKSAFNDVMVVTKIANGTQLLGYNLTVSMCQYNPLIMPGRPLSGFSTPMGIVLNQATNCGIGSVDNALVEMMAGAYQNYQQTKVQTTFTTVGCGGAGGYTGGGYTGGGYVGGVNIPGGY